MKYGRLTLESTPAQFRRVCERAFKAANPDACETLVITWERAHRITWPTGLRGHCGEFIARADGYRAKRVFPTWSPETGLSV